LGKEVNTLGWGTLDVSKKGKQWTEKTKLLDAQTKAGGRKPYKGDERKFEVGHDQE